MGVIWNLVSLAKNAKQAVGAFDQAKGRAVRGYRMLHEAQDALVQQEYERAAAGNMQAQYEMGERCYQGLGVPKDYEAAAAWFLLAANQGHPGAQRTLAMMCFLGRGVPPDPIEAYKWIHLASLRGEEEAIGVKRKIAAKIPPEAVVEGEKRAAAFQTRPLPAR